MRLLDLFSGAGGAAMGYHRAGFEVVGIDNLPQPRYPFRFIQADALAYVAEHGHEFDAIHASPPCQRYSRCIHIPNRDMSTYGDHIGALRALLITTGRPWVIENVVGAPFSSGIQLCGTMFGLRVYRHRRFESSHLLLAPPHRRHAEPIKALGSWQVAGYQGRPGAMVTVAGHMFSRASGSVAMGIDWMARDELAEAVPPAYTEYIGRQLALACA